MTNLGKYSVKELANTGVDFYLRDDDTGEDLPVKFVVYGIDGEQVTKARRKFTEITSAKNVKPWKEDEALLEFITSAIKSWDTFEFGELVVKDGDREALKTFFEECPQFKGQLSEFISDRTHFLAG